MRIQKMKGFGYNRLARAPRWRKLLRLSYRPTMIGVAAAQQSHQKARVNEDVSGRSPSS